VGGSGEATEGVCHHIEVGWVHGEREEEEEKFITSGNLEASTTRRRVDPPRRREGDLASRTVPLADPHGHL
jgi:hypothetical protein